MHFLNYYAYFLLVKNMHKILLKHKKYIIFITLLIIVSFILGYLYYNNINDNQKLNIINTIKSNKTWHYNYIFKDLIWMSLIIVLSFLIVGIPLGVIYIFYESFSLGFITKVFISIYRLKGLLFIILFIILIKLIILLLKVCFVKKTLNYGRLLIGSFIYKHDSNIKDKIFYNFKNALYLLLFVLVINIIMFFISPSILKKISFLL